MAEHKSEHKEKYSDSQKASFFMEEAKVKILQGRVSETWSSVGDYLFAHYPVNYINICNKYFGGSVRVISVNQ